MTDDKTLRYMPWYPRDFMCSTRGWPLVARGVYRELLDAQWDMGTLPVAIAELQAIAGASDAEWQVAWPRIEPKFPINCEGRKNQRLEVHRSKVEQVSAMRSELGRRGGLAKARAIATAKASDLLQQNSSIPNPNPNPNPNPEVRKRSQNRSVARKRCPDDFELTPERRYMASIEAPDVDAEREFAKFRDFEFKSAHKDWEATFRNWLRTAQDRAAPKLRGNGSVVTAAGAVWERLIRSGGADPPRTASIDSALRACGGWSAIRMRTPFDEPKLKRLFEEGYHAVAG